MWCFLSSPHLVGPVEPLSAPRPDAPEGENVRVGGQVGAEVAALGVVLAAPGEVAVVLASARAPRGCPLAVGTLAH